MGMGKGKGKMEGEGRRGESEQSERFGDDMNKIAAFLLALAASSAAFAQTVAEVNGEPIDSARVERLAKACCADSRDRFSEALALAISYEPFLQQARKMGLSPDPDVIRDLSSQPSSNAFHYREFEWAQDQLIRAYAEMYVPTDQDVETAYKAAADFAQQSQKRGEKEYLYGEIVTKSKKEADLALKEIRSGRPFAEIMLRRSIDPAKKAQAAPDGMKSTPLMNAPRKWDGLGMMAPGDVSGEPIYDFSERVYSIYKLEGSRPMRIPTLAQCRPAVERFVKRYMAQKETYDLSAGALVESNNRDALGKIMKWDMKFGLAEFAGPNYDFLWQ